MRTHLFPLVFLGFVALLASPAFVAKADAAAPSTVALEGALTSAGGGPATDGTYALTVRLYAAASGGAALWSEVSKAVVVKNGGFSLVLGAQKAISSSALDVDGGPWLSVQVGTDPELARTRVRAVLYALRASAAVTAQTAKAAITAKTAESAKTADSAKTALNLTCTGCVSVKELAFDDNVDLGKFSLKAKSGIFASTVAASGFIGDGSKLTGISQPKGDCPKGQVVIGIAADGSLKCAPGATGNTVLNGRLTDEFTETALVPTMPLSIPDNTGASAAVNAVFGKVGTANTISVTIHVENTDLSKVAITLLPPNDKAKGLTVCDPCGAKDSKIYKATLTENSTLKVGSLKSFIGKPLVGSWTLKVLDTSYCVPQAPGNAKYCHTTKKLDGSLLAFAISAKVTSAQSIGTPGTFQFGLLAKPPFTCVAAKMGHAYFDLGMKKLRYCDGTVWRALSDTCGNGIIEAGEACDDGNNTGGDGCTAVCAWGMGKSAADATPSCKQLLASDKATKSGVYWVDFDGAGAGKPQQAYCEMKISGGGWTRFLRHSDPNGLTKLSVAKWDAAIANAAAGGIKEWMVRTFSAPSHSSEAGSAHVNAFVLKLSAAAIGSKFNHFKHVNSGACGQHRYLGTSWVSSATILPGSECTAWHGGDSSGRYIWGEHTWCNHGGDRGWMWMSRCSSPTVYHMLIVNHDYNYPPRGETLIGTNKSPKGTHTNYDEDGGAYEFFMR